MIQPKQQIIQYHLEGERLFTLSLVLLLSFVLLTGILPARANDQEIVSVPDDYPSISAALTTISDGGTIEISAGEYTEAIVIDRPVTLRGVGNGEKRVSTSEDVPVIYIADTEGVVIEGLTIKGGQHGVLIVRSQNIIIRENSISENRLTGIKVRLGAAAILNNTITNTTSPYGRGIWITNTMAWPESRVFANIITDHPWSGITTNMVANVLIDANTVMGNGKDGIAVTEMSHSLLRDNVVGENGENGIYISDMSMATVCGNMVMNSALPTIAGSGRYGNGITVDYHSQAQLYDNTVRGNARHGISVIAGSAIIIGDNQFDQNLRDPVAIHDSSQRRQSGLFQSAEC
jgi:nitrous oxidase accessory protein